MRRAEGLEVPTTLIMEQPAPPEDRPEVVSRWCLGGERLNGKEWRRSMDFISKGSINPSLERSLRSQLRLVEMYLYKCHFPDEKVFQGM